MARRSRHHAPRSPSASSHSGAPPRGRPRRPHAAVPLDRVRRRPRPVASRREKKRYLLRLTGQRCVYCCHPLNDGTPARQATLDHVIPRSKGGSDALENLVPACRACNQLKADAPLAEFFAVHPWASAGFLRLARIAARQARRLARAASRRRRTEEDEVRAVEGRPWKDERRRRRRRKLRRAARARQARHESSATRVADAITAPLVPTARPVSRAA